MADVPYPLCSDLSTSKTYSRNLASRKCTICVLLCPSSSTNSTLITPLLLNTLDGERELDNNEETSILIKPEIQRRILCLASPRRMLCSLRRPVPPSEVTAGWYAPPAIKRLIFSTLARDSSTRGPGTTSLEILIFSCPWCISASTKTSGSIELPEWRRMLSNTIEKISENNCRSINSGSNPKDNSRRGSKS